MTQMVNIVPNRLFFSRLPNGELEFSCLVRLTEGTDCSRVSWTLRGTDDDQHALTFRRPVRDEELRSGRAQLAAMLPPGWPVSVLTVDLGNGRAERSVLRFDQRQAFGLPFATDVLVVAGHRVGEHHRAAFGIPTQQFAWDIVGLQAETLAVFNNPPGDPPRSTDLAGFGQQVLAPAAGVVVTVTDGLADAEMLGEQSSPAAGQDLAWAIGNHVVIEHDDGVFSCLAHLKRNSTAVSVGEQVTAGSVIGALGSSGNTTGPHLHLQFMDGPDLFTAAPLPVELTAEGETCAPISGQLVAP